MCGGERGGPLSYILEASAQDYSEAKEDLLAC